MLQAPGLEVNDSPCPVVEAMVKDAKATIKKTDDALVDVVILAAVDESEHYEIAVYDTLITNAEARGPRRLSLCFSATVTRKSTRCRSLARR